MRIHIASIAVLEPRPRGFAHECFAVTAFVAGEESEMSPPSCVATTSSPRSLPRVGAKA